MPDHLDEWDLDRCLNDLIAGKADSPECHLGPGVLETIRTTLALAKSPLPDRSSPRLDAAIQAEMARLDTVAGGATRVGRDGQAPPLTGSGESQSWGLFQRRWPVGQLATAALLLLVLVGSLVVINPHRNWRPDNMPAILPAAIATPATPQPVTTETILDTAVAALPAGRVRIAVDRWRLQPSPSSVTLPEHVGLVRMTVDAGEVIVTVSGSDRRLMPGDVLDVTNQEFSFRAVGTSPAVAYLVYVTSDLNLNAEAGQSHARIWKSGDPLVHTMDFVISSSADEMPGGPGWLLLERVTIPPGGALAPQIANPWIWTEVGAGTLGLTLEGEHLPYRWQSGTEHKFPFGGDYFPQFLASGTTMRMRNAGETPLVLYRLTLLPAEVGTPDTVSPTVRPP